MKPIANAIMVGSTKIGKYFLIAFCIVSSFPDKSPAKKTAGAPVKHIFNWRNVSEKDV